MRHCILFLLFLILSREAVADPDIEQLNSQISAIMQKHKIPGLSYAIEGPGKSTRSFYFGTASLEANQPIDANTQFRVASISKVVVGIAIMQLVESQQLALSDKLSDLLPKVSFSNPWSTTDPIQLVHLLENTTGWDEIPLQAFAYDNTDRLPLLEAIERFPQNRESRWPAGTRHAYTNVTAAIGALLVEEVTGIPFDTYVEQYIFAPLGINNSSYANVPERVATSYNIDNSVAPYKPILFPHAGGLSMTTDGMSKLMSAFIYRDERILKRETYARIEQSHSTNVGQFSAGYGIFNYARYYDGWRFRGHDGAFPGTRAEMSYSAQFGSGFVVLQNSENDRAFRAIVTLISNYIAQDFHAIEHSSIAIAGDGPDVQGFYRYLNPRVQKRYFLERFIASNHLAETSESWSFTSVLPPGWARELTYVGNGTWVNNRQQPVMKAATDPLLGSVLHYGDRVFVRESGFFAWIDKVLLVLWLLCALIALPVSTIWCFKTARKRYDTPADVKSRLSISFMWLCTWLFVILLIVGFQSPITRLGQPSIVSIGIMLSSIVLVGVTAYATYIFCRNRRQTKGRLILLFGSVSVSILICVVTYLMYFGVVGIRTWH